MIKATVLFLGAILRLFRTRRNLLLENLALRQQLAALERRHPRPTLAAFDRLFWVLARRLRALEEENGRLKNIVAQQALDIYELAVLTGIGVGATMHRPPTPKVH